MTERYAQLFRDHAEEITRLWIDEIHADQSTQLTHLLSYQELVAHLPEFFDCLAHLLDWRATPAEIAEAALELRSHAQGRFHRGCLIDEVARELMLLRRVIIDLLWREVAGGADVEISEVREALRRTDIFIDESIAQTVLIYAANLRPSVRTRTPMWPPPRRHKAISSKRDER